MGRRQLLPNFLCRAACQPVLDFFDLRDYFAECRGSRPRLLVEAGTLGVVVFRPAIVVGRLDALSATGPSALWSSPQIWEPGRTASGVDEKGLRDE